jgi:hypothetical protein
MQNIQIQNIRPQIQSYIKAENPAEKIAVLFYYSSAAVLWTAGMLGLIAFLVIFLFEPGMALGILILALILGFPGWVWAGIGLVLFRCHKTYHNLGLGKAGAVSMWLGTIGYNAIQAAYIFNYLNDYVILNAVAGWNLIVISLSFFALYFELKKA